MIDIKDWKSNKKGNLINDIKKLISGRSGISCDHCERQYDDDICDGCFAVLLVNKFQETLVTKEPSNV